MSTAASHPHRTAGVSFHAGSPDPGRRVDRADVGELRGLVGSRVLAHESDRPNVLLADPDGSIRRALDGPGALLPAPVCRWPRETPPWCLARPVRTLVLDGPEALDATEQDRLFLWLEAQGRHVQVVSIVRRPLFALVEAGAFCADLYYRLNTVRVSRTDPARAWLP